MSAAAHARVISRGGKERERSRDGVDSNCVTYQARVRECSIIVCALARRARMALAMRGGREEKEGKWKVAEEGGGEEERE